MDKFNKDANISNIEDFLYVNLAPVLDNIYVGFVPDMLKEEDDDTLVMIDITSPIKYTTIPKAYVDIVLCAKNAGFSKNSHKLKEMEDKLDSVIEKFQDENNIYMMRKLEATTEPFKDVPYYSNIITIEVSVFKNKY